MSSTTENETVQQQVSEETKDVYINLNDGILHLY